MRFFTLPTLAFGSALCLAVAACAVSYPIAPADASAGGSASGGFSATGGNGGTGGTGGIAGTGATGGNGGADVGTGGTGGIAGAGGTGGLDGGTDASTGGTGGATTSGTSCQTPGPGLTDCGPGKESCCTSPLVKGGTFNRSNDPKYPATVSDFRLDKYEITVGRFRKFVAAWDGGWRPTAGSGKHAYLNGGKGLSDSSKPGSYESGWSTTWNAQFAGNKAAWDSDLLCRSTYQTWTSSAASDERRPINCVDWYETAAFCIWDGGFLPSEAEWNYAASGGSEQRVYPWSSPPSSTVIDCTYANYDGASGGGSCVPGASTNDVGSESPKGDGRWGQSDLAGNVWDWILDQYSSYAAPCNNCAYLASSNRVCRGGSFARSASGLLTSNRADAAYRNYNIGARCARTP